MGCLQEQGLETLLYRLQQQPFFLKYFYLICYLPESNVTQVTIIYIFFNLYI